MASKRKQERARKIAAAKRARQDRPAGQSRYAKKMAAQRRGNFTVHFRKAFPNATVSDREG